MQVCKASLHQWGTQGSWRSRSEPRLHPTASHKHAPRLACSCRWAGCICTVTWPHTSATAQPTPSRSRQPAAARLAIAGRSSPSRRGRAPACRCVRAPGHACRFTGAGPQPGRLSSQPPACALHVQFRPKQCATLGAILQGRAGSLATPVCAMVWLLVRSSDTDASPASSQPWQRPLLPPVAAGAQRAAVHPCAARRHGLCRAVHLHGRVL